MVTFDANCFCKIAKQTWHSDLSVSQLANKPFCERKFKSFFKVCPEGCEFLWDQLEWCCRDRSVQMTNGGGLKFFWKDVRPNHLLWCLYYMKVYCSEQVAASLFGVTPKTYRKYVWVMIKFLSWLSQHLVSICINCYDCLLLYKTYFFFHSLLPLLLHRSTGKRGCWVIMAQNARLASMG